jgi:pyruvate carboxylase
LQEFVLTGPATTIPFHRSLLQEPDFQAGRITTYFIQEHPALLERVRSFTAEHSPFESFYGSPEVAAAIGAIVAVSEGKG